MLRYTVRPEVAVHQKIQSDIDKILLSVKKLCGSELAAVLLTGGFGRGEGSVLWDGANVRYLSDYDVSIVLRPRNSLGFFWQYRKYAGALSKLADTLAQEIVVKQIDLQLRPPGYFSPRRRVTMESLETRAAHHLLFGSEDPCATMPEFDIRGLPLTEGAILFKNRGLGLLMAGSYLFANDGRIPEEFHLNFFIECNKAVLALGDSVLLLSGNYRVSYAERLRQAQAMERCDFATILEHYAQALTFKLVPEFAYCPSFRPLDYWSNLSSSYLDFFQHFESRRLHRKDCEWLEYLKAMRSKRNLGIRRMLKTLLQDPSRLLSPDERAGASLFGNPGLVTAVVALLLKANPAAGGERDLEEIAGMLRHRLTGDHRRDWLQLVRRLLMLVHPDGEAGRAARAIAATCSSAN